MLEALYIFGAKYLLVAPVLIALVFFIRSKEKKRMILLVVISFPLAYILAKIGSHFYFDTRPFVVGNFTPLIPHAADNGFPSDHVLLAAAIAAVVGIFDKEKIWGLILWIIMLLIGFSRVLVGVHHWRDIAASIVIALLATFLVNNRLNKYY